MKYPVHLLCLFFSCFIIACGENPKQPTTPLADPTLICPAPNLSIYCRIYDSSLVKSRWEIEKLTEGNQVLFFQLVYDDWLAKDEEFSKSLIITLPNPESIQRGFNYPLHHPSFDLRAQFESAWSPPKDYHSLSGEINFVQLDQDSATVITRIDGFLGDSPEREIIFNGKMKFWRNGNKSWEFRQENPEGYFKK